MTLLAVGWICSIASTAVAAPGTAALERARHAWDDGEMDKAEREYREALESGGLDRAATLECWIHVGAARAVLGKKVAAIAAFHTALLIDDNFGVPPEAGKKAETLAQAARHQRNRAHALALSVNAPADTPSGDAFAVDVTLPDGQAALVGHVTLHVRDTTTHKTYDNDQPAAAVVHFRVPASMTLPGASLQVEVSALDAHANQLTSDLQHVTVRRANPIAESHPTMDVLGPAGGSTSHGGFWSSPWPWIIGGAALAAGGGTAAYFLLKPPDQVLIGPAQLQTH